MRLTHVLAVLALALPPLAAQDESPRPAERILRDFHSVVLPSMSAGNSPEAIAAFHRQISEACTRQGELALELYHAYPDHPQLPHVLSLRWAGMTNAMKRADEVLAETAPLLEQNVSDGLRREILHARARASLASSRLARTARFAAIQAAVDGDPEDERCGVYLMDFARQFAVTPESMKGIAQMALENWPDSSWVANPAKGLLRQLDKVGKPYPLAFEDIVAGQAIDVAKTGKRFVLVVLWSGDSERIAGELAIVRELRARHADDLAVVGVYNFRHKGGVDGVRAELRKTGIDWPTLYDEARVESPWKGPFAVPQTPFYYLLDGGGTVVAPGYRAQAIATLLRTRLSI